MALASGIVLAGQCHRLNRGHGIFPPLTAAGEEHLDKGLFAELWMGELPVEHKAFHAFASLEGDGDMAAVIKGGLDLSFQLTGWSWHRLRPQASPSRHGCRVEEVATTGTAGPSVASKHLAATARRMNAMIRWLPALVLGFWRPTTASPGHWPERGSSRRSAVSSGCRRQTVRWLVRLQGRRGAAPSTRRMRGRWCGGRQPARTGGTTGRPLGATSVDGSWPPLCARSQRGATRRRPAL